MKKISGIDSCQNCPLSGNDMAENLICTHPKIMEVGDVVIEKPDEIRMDCPLEDQLESIQVSRIRERIEERKKERDCCNSDILTKYLDGRIKELEKLLEGKP